MSRCFPKTTAPTVYVSSLRLVNETDTGVIERTLRRSFDAYGRSLSTTALSGADAEHQVSYAYDTAGRIAAIITGASAPSPANTFAYSYAPNCASLIASVTGPVLTGTVPVGSVANTWESPKSGSPPKFRSVGPCLIAAASGT